MPTIIHNIPSDLLYLIQPSDVTILKSDEKVEISVLRDKQNM